jgi:hypothetical protein
VRSEDINFAKFVGHNRRAIRFAPKKMISPTPGQQYARIVRLHKGSNRLISSGETVKRVGKSRELGIVQTQRNSLVAFVYQQGIGATLFLNGPNERTLVTGLRLLVNT